MLWLVDSCHVPEYVDHHVLQIELNNTKKLTLLSPLQASSPLSYNCTQEGFTLLPWIERSSHYIRRSNSKWYGDGGWPADLLVSKLLFLYRCVCACVCVRACVAQMIYRKVPVCWLNCLEVGMCRWELLADNWCPYDLILYWKIIIIVSIMKNVTGYLHCRLMQFRFNFNSFYIKYCELVDLFKLLL